MSRYGFLGLLVACIFLLPTIGLAADTPAGKKSTVKDVKAMSEKDQTALALSAAPARVAKDAGVMIVPDPPLARTLYANVDIGRQIPEDMFHAVAQLLAYVYRIAGLRSAAA